MILNKIGVLGAGGQALEVLAYAKDLGISVEFFFVESDYARENSVSDYGIPIINENDNLEKYRDVAVISATGSPYLRKRLIGLWPFDNFATLIHPSAKIASDASIGKGSLVGPNSFISAKTIIGEHVLINAMCSVSHGSIIMDFATLSPGVIICGDSVCEKGVFLGAASCVLEKTQVGTGSIVAAGAIVTKSIEPLEMFAGIPAVKKKQISRWY